MRPVRKRLIDAAVKLMKENENGYSIWTEGNSIDAKTQLIIYLGDKYFKSVDEIKNRFRDLQSMRNILYAIIRESRNRMKEIRPLQRVTHYYRRERILMRMINNTAGRFRSIMNIIRESKNGSRGLRHSQQ